MLPRCPRSSVTMAQKHKTFLVFASSCKNSLFDSMIFWQCLYLHKHTLYSSYSAEDKPTVVMVAFGQKWQRTELIMTCWTHLVLMFLGCLTFFYYSQIFPHGKCWKVCFCQCWLGLLWLKPPLTGLTLSLSGTH